MAALDRSIFRERAIEKYTQRQELNVILRLVSPRMFLLLWALFILSLGAAALAWTIQEPVNISGSAIVIQQKVNKGQQVVVLLLFPTDQRANLHVGQPVHIAINTSNISFTSSIQSVETNVMSPDTIRTQFGVPTSLAQVITGPSAVALAGVEPASQATTYLGSQCQAQVQVGSESALSMLPGFNDVPNELNTFLRNAASMFPSSSPLSNLFSRLKNSFSH